MKCLNASGSLNLNILHPFPKGRIFAIDIRDQFEVARPLLQEKHELIVSPTLLYCCHCRHDFPYLKVESVIKPGYQPSRLPEAPFFLGKCKNNVRASERKLTVSIYAQDQLLPFNFVDAQLQCQIEISGTLRKAENVQIEDDVVALDEDEYSRCVIDCLDYGDQATARESAEIGEDVSEEAEASNEVVQVRPSDTMFSATELHGLDEHRDPARSIIMSVLRLTVKYPC